MHRRASAGGAKPLVILSILAILVSTLLTCVVLPVSGFFLGEFVLLAALILVPIILLLGYAGNVLFLFFLRAVRSTWRIGRWPAVSSRS